MLHYIKFICSEQGCKLDVILYKICIHIKYVWIELKDTIGSQFQKLSEMQILQELTVMNSLAQSIFVVRCSEICDNYLCVYHTPPPPKKRCKSVLSPSWLTVHQNTVNVCVVPLPYAIPVKCNWNNVFWEWNVSIYVCNVNKCQISHLERWIAMSSWEWFLDLDRSYLSERLLTVM